MGGPRPDLRELIEASDNLGKARGTRSDALMKLYKRVKKLPRHNALIGGGLGLAAGGGAGLLAHKHLKKKKATVGGYA